MVCSFCNSDILNYIKYKNKIYCIDCWEKSKKEREKQNDNIQ